ncbi:hypothetical protein R6Q59_020606 [Mikania micrantha]
MMPFLSSFQISKLNALCDSNSEIRLKYKLHGQDLDALIFVFDEDAVDNMLYEYDLLRRISTVSVKLCVFVFFFPATSVDIPAAVNGSENVGFLDATPVMIQEIPPPGGTWQLCFSDIQRIFSEWSAQGR